MVLGRAKTPPPSRTDNLLKENQNWIPKRYLCPEPSSVIAAQSYGAECSLWLEIFRVHWFCFLADFFDNTLSSFLFC